MTTGLGITIAAMLAASYSCTSVKIDTPKSPGTVYVAGGFLTVADDSLTVTFCIPRSTEKQR